MRCLLAEGLPMLPASSETTILILQCTSRPSRVFDMKFMFDSSTVRPIKDQESWASILLYRRQNYKLNRLLDRAAFPSCALKRDMHAHTN